MKLVNPDAPIWKDYFKWDDYGLCRPTLWNALECLMNDMELQLLPNVPYYNTVEEFGAVWHCCLAVELSQLKLKQRCEQINIVHINKCDT